jgi:hypothetical protein
MSHRNRKPTADKAPAGGRPSVNGEVRTSRTRREKGGKAKNPSEHLDEAVENPGGAEVKPKARKNTKLLDEIPTSSTRAGRRGRPLQVSPAVVNVRLDRPGEFSRLLFTRDDVEYFDLLAFQAGRDAPAEYYYVEESLQPAVRQHLRTMCVHLVADLNGRGDYFLFMVPLSDRSPYYCAVQQILSYDDEFLKAHVFSVGKAYREKGDSGPMRCDVFVDDVGPDDPLPVKPSRPIAKLLAGALGSERIIQDPSHEVYHTLTSRRRLS